MPADRFLSNFLRLVLTPFINIEIHKEMRKFKQLRVKGSQGFLLGLISRLKNTNAKSFVYQPKKTEEYAKGIFRWLEEVAVFKSPLKKYFERLCVLYRKGIVKEVGLNRDYIINMAKKMESLSPEEKRLRINCDI